ncbi:MAG: hypothetical protein AB7Y46_07025 [Armatimonadota bacterium]
MRLTDTVRGRSPRAGVAGAWLAVAFVALAGSAALVIDLGSLVVAAQRCQDVADSAALGAGLRLPEETAARAAALATVAANNSQGVGWLVVCEPEDVEFFGPGTTVDGISLGPYAHAMRVAVSAPVRYSFARLLGVEGAVARRHATILRAPVRGIPLCPMWISHTTPMQPGELVQMLMADGPHYADVPGSFGFLQAPVGCTATGFELLQGYNLTLEDIETSYVYGRDPVTGASGSLLYADTGVDVGSFRKALKSDQGRARLERGTTGIWALDNYLVHRDDNPRIMLVPLVSFVGGTGSNAQFQIEKFGAFWLEEVQGGQKKIYGRFITHDLPGGDPDSSLTTDCGIFATKLVG